MEIEEVAEAVSRGLGPPRCPKCGAVIKYLRYCGLEWQTADFYLTRHGGEYGNWESSSAWKEDEDQYCCPECSEVLFKTYEEAEKFLKFWRKMEEEIEEAARAVSRGLGPPMEYRGYFNRVNEKPDGEFIEVFASDWNKDHWAFYAFISLDSYEEDIKEINDLIHRLNWRDGDVYVELINHSEGLRDFYHKLYEEGHFTHHAALEVENWRKAAHFGGLWGSSYQVSGSSSPPTTSY